MVTKDAAQLLSDFGGAIMKCPAASKTPYNDQKCAAFGDMTFPVFRNTLNVYLSQRGYEPCGGAWRFDQLVYSGFFCRRDGAVMGVGFAPINILNPQATSLLYTAKPWR